MRRAQRLKIGSTLLALSIVMTGSLVVQAEANSPISSSLQAAQNLVEQGKLEQAESLLNDVLQQHPEALAAYNNLAVIYAKQGKLQAARDVLKKGLMVNSQVAALYQNLDAVYVELSRQEYGKALRIDIKERQLALKPVGYPGPVVQSEESQRNEETLLSRANETSVSTPEVDPVSNQVNTLIQGWASAWSAQEVDLYLSFYDREFVPPNGLSRNAWEQQRRLRLKKPEWVKVSVSELNIESLYDGKATVRFLQHYKSNTYTDQSRKEIGLSQTEQGWRIVSENSF